MIGCISPKWLPQCFSSNVLFLQCKILLPPKGLFMYVGGHTAMGRMILFDFRGWVLKKWYNFLLLLRCSQWNQASMLWGSPSHPMESPIWGRTDSINWPAIWMSHCRRGTSSFSEAASADAKWRELSWLHWTVFKLQIREQNTWLLSFKLLSLGMACFLAMVTGKILFLFISRKWIFLPPMSPPKPQHQHLEKNQTS